MMVSLKELREHVRVARTTSGATEKGIIAFLLLTAIFASLSVLARYLNTDFTILQQVYLRVLAAFFLALVVFRKHLSWTRIANTSFREWLVIIFRGFAIYGIGVTFISKAATMTLIGNVAFISALPFVPMLGFMFLKEKITWWKIIFILGSILGVALLSIRNIHDLFSWGVGDIYAILATFGFSVGYVTRRWHNDTLNNREITTLTFIFGIGSTALLSLILGEGVPKLDNSLVIWLAIVFGGVLNVANLLLINYGFQHVDAVRGGNLLTLESVWGLLFGLLFFHEWPTWRGLLGGICIIICVIGMNLYNYWGEAKIASIQDDSHLQ